MKYPRDNKPPITALIAITTPIALPAGIRTGPLEFDAPAFGLVELPDFSSKYCKEYPETPANPSKQTTHNASAHKSLYSPPLNRLSFFGTND